ncbi:response regulator transcription factor [Dyella acidisoli]|uniref:DNA-binding response regulator n=1 Tax=Dyella acidisoli TaxID=1867834 RepID=A0ABQ5XQK9_9GAMM|nr:response regulator transcription factor [Dyella acidisoli]GLQ92856.1 DNA-binding response regulator [Dyella acidisoli]
MPHVLVIEDDEVTAREIALELAAHGISADRVHSGNEGLKAAQEPHYDAITLDLMLPGMDGLSLVKQLRERGISTPVLMISALGDVDERVRGLRAGGDDYLTKPFAPDEMAARIEVLLRRQQPAQTKLRAGDLELDLITHIARRGGRELSLLPTEYRLLEFLMRYPGQVLTRAMIFESVWGLRFDPGTNLIDVHIARLRRKVDAEGEPSLIRTVRGSGYRLG